MKLTIEDLRWEYEMYAEARLRINETPIGYSEYLEHRLIVKDPKRYSTNEKYRFQIVDSETGKNVSDYEMTGKELHHGLHYIFMNALNNEDKPIITNEELIRLGNEYIANPKYDSDGHKGSFINGIKKGLSLQYKPVELQKGSDDGEAKFKSKPLPNPHTGTFKGFSLQGNTTTPNINYKHVEDDICILITDYNLKNITGIQLCDKLIELIKEYNTKTQ